MAASYTTPVFYNVVNGLQPQATPAGAARLHRPGGGYYNGFLFISTPRGNDQNGYFLDIEVNPVSVAPQPSGQVDVTLIPSGNTYGLTGPMQGRLLSLVEAFGLDAPTVIWAETPYVGGGGNVSGTSFSYYVPAFDANNTYIPPEVTDIKPLTFDGVPTGPIGDFTTANANGRIVLFWLSPDGVTISYTTFDGVTAGTAQTLITAPAGTQFFGIDAAAVQMIDFQSNAQTTKIAVVALASTGLLGWLVDASLDTPPASFPMPQLPDNLQSPMSAIRVGWGTLPSGDNPDAPSTSALSNGLVLLYVGSTGAGQDFNNTSDSDGVGYGLENINILDLTSPSFTASDWQNMPIDPQNWVEPVFPETLSGQEAAMSAPMTVLFPIAIPNTSVPNSVTYYLGLGNSIQVIYFLPGEFQPSENFNVQFFNAFQFALSSPGEPTSTAVQPDFGPDDVAAAISSWTLLGLITGLPPYFPSQPPGTVTLTFALTQTGSNGTTVGSTQLVTVGGGYGVAEGSVQRAVTQSNSNQTTWTKSESISWDNSTLLPHQGVAIYWIPKYQCATLSVANGVGQATGLTISLTWTAGVDTLFQVLFTLSDLNTPVKSSDPTLQAIQNAFSDFTAVAGGASLVQWPPSNHPCAWKGVIPSTWMAKPLDVQPDSFTVEPFDSSHSVTLTFGQTTEQSTQNVTTVKFSLEAPLLKALFGITVKTEGELDFNTTVDTTFGQTQTFTVVYTNWPNPGALQITPILLQPTVDNAPWVPTLNGAQRPWLLTWTAGGPGC